MKYANLFIFLFIVGCSSEQYKSENNPLNTDIHNPIGFRGELLGSAPAPNMIRIEKELFLGIDSREISDAYKKKDEPMKLGEFDINEVIYEYYDNKLFKISVDLTTDSQRFCTGFKEITAALELQYKIPMKTYQYNDEFGLHLSQWRGDPDWVSYFCSVQKIGSDSGPYVNVITFEDRVMSQKVENVLKEMKNKKSQKSSIDVMKSL